ncbi:MAG: ribosomal RNA small subunit methyltransferase A [Elusimicrobia bacterium]|nr:ribosomal RNA small subunit methyltransferase A [Elusimicrobiota bacterium]
MGARLGQHFLKDPVVRGRILAAARIQRGDSVVEIGPGRGFLTRELLRLSDLTAVEMDERLAESLRLELGAESGLRLIASDFLKVEPAALGRPPLKFVANLPYSVATPILQRILSWDCWSSAVLMFQKEVALRITAGPGSRDYGLLTLSAAIKAEAELVAAAPAESFSPKPKVESAVVLLRRRAAPLVRPEREDGFFRVARAAFSQRRKTVLHPLCGGLGIGRETALAALERCGIPSRARAEEIPLEGFLKLADILGRPG